MQINVECFGVAHGVKVKNIIEMQCGYKKLKKENNNQKQDCLVITMEMVCKQSRKIPNWKTPGREGVQGLWITKLTNLHEQTSFLEWKSTIA